MQRFDLSYEDEFAIQTAKNVARRLLRDPRITPEQIIGLGIALSALERMPDATPGCNAVFGIDYQAGDDEFRELCQIEFRISESAFEIFTGGSVTSQGGSDTFADLKWVIEMGGQSRQCEIYSLESEIEEFLQMGATISVAADSDLT